MELKMAKNLLGEIETTGSDEREIAFAFGNAAQEVCEALVPVKEALLQLKAGLEQYEDHLRHRVID
jgi:hypothetical protein